MALAAAAANTVLTPDTLHMLNAKAETAMTDCRMTRLGTWVLGCLMRMTGHGLTEADPSAMLFLLTGGGVLVLPVDLCRPAARCDDVERRRLFSSTWY